MSVVYLTLLVHFTNELRDSETSQHLNSANAKQKETWKGLLYMCKNLKKEEGTDIMYMYRLS